MEAASLTGALLSIKGRANAAGFKPGRPRKGTIRRTPWAVSELNDGPQAPPAPTHAAGGCEARHSAEPSASAASPAATESVKMTLRLDRSRHLRLKLASAHQRTTGQQLLVAALDRYLADLAPCALGRKCACLADAEGAGTANRLPPEVPCDRTGGSG